MFPSLPQGVQDELAELARQYGQPLVHAADLGNSTMFDPLNRTDRYGEVCMVVRRPNDHLLTMLKTFYPIGAYRLLTGGINYGEHVYDALLREVHEETGLEVRVNRFLAAVAYRLTSTGETPIFYTFAFLLDEMSGTLNVIDQSERVEAFREIEPKNLPTIADYLSHIKPEMSREIGGNWEDWGRFRAVIHCVVWKAL